MSALMTLLGKGKDWAVCKKEMADPKFVDRLTNYDKDNSNEAVIARVEANYTSKDNFRPEIIKQKSAAAANICTWVRGIVDYHKICKQLKPMKQGAQQNQQP